MPDIFTKLDSMTKQQAHLACANIREYIHASDFPEANLDGFFNEFNNYVYNQPALNIRMRREVMSYANSTALGDLFYDQICAWLTQFENKK